MLDDEELVKKLLEAAKKQARLKSPHLVSLVNVYQIQQSTYCSKFFKVYMAFEYHAITLRKQIEHKKKKEQVFSEAQLVQLIAGILTALAHLQEHALSHESLMPENILLDEKRCYKITDAHFLTKTDSYQRFLLGIEQPWYFSPEQLACLSHRERFPQYDVSKSEVFVLGLIALEAATLTAPSSLYNFEEFSISVPLLREQLEQVEVRYSEALAKTLAQMLATDAGSRPSVPQMLDRIRALFERELQQGKSSDKASDYSELRIQSSQANNLNSDAAVRQNKLSVSSNDQICSQSLYHELNKSSLPSAKSGFVCLNKPLSSDPRRYSVGRNSLRNSRVLDVSRSDPSALQDNSYVNISAYLARSVIPQPPLHQPVNAQMQRPPVADQKPLYRAESSMDI